MSRTKRSLFTILGPGILMAAAAIGASHLVQSTRAGADFGFQLLWLAVLANVMKYPFFEFGQRYAASTGQTLLAGYRKLGLPYLLVFLSISLVTMVLSITALVVVTAGLAENLIQYFFDRTLGPRNLVWWALIIIVVCNGLILVGRYRALDLVVKVIVGVLGITAVVAAIAAAVTHQPASSLAQGNTSGGAWTLASLPFLLALMGWMPAPIELSTWGGVWMQQRERETGYRPTLREALIDFNIGYGACIVLAIAFLSLGALVMHGSGETFSNSGAVFARQLVELFEQSIGTWCGPVVAIAAFTCMFSTVLTCLDGYPRSNAAAILEISRKTGQVRFSQVRFSGRSMVFWGLNLFCCIATIVVVLFAVTGIKTMVDIATIVAFVAAPVLGFLNLRLMLGGDVPAEARPPRWLMALAWVGLAFLSAFTVVYLLLRVGVFEPAAGS